jgi:tetrahydromethanopterin S-methyltransferase subunit G
MKPSRPRVFVEPRLFRASKTSSLEGIEHKKTFSSSEMMERISPTFQLLLVNLKK